MVIPTVSGLSNIVMRKLKGLHRQTITSYIQVSMTIFTIVMIAIKQSFPQLLELFKAFEWLDWVYVVLISFGTVSN